MKKKSAKEFVEYWKGKGYEKGESQAFWLSLLRDVYQVSEPEKYISFENQVMLDHTSFIDGYIEATHVMIEQKGLGKDLRKGIKQSDGSVLSPYQQAVRYSAMLPYSKRPRWIITCNFAEFLVYDMEKPNAEPQQIFLKDLPTDYYRMQFLVDKADERVQKEMQVSLEAGEIVGKLYDALLKQYKNPDSADTLKSLNKLCVRLVFCFYADSANLFGKRKMFSEYMRQFTAKEFRNKLIELFRIFDTQERERDPYLDEDLLAFPYVNGGLFADEVIEIPRFTDDIINLILNQAEGFDWSAISPTIFGAVFESTLNPATRRSGGMHYTAVDNIHKVIDPLFLNELKADLQRIKALKNRTERNRKLQTFRDRLSTLVFLDPACGSGNFLTQTYIELRRLENEALFAESEGQGMFQLDDLIQVSIGQFYGFEINDFAVTVTKTALWIAESQMMQETEEIMNVNLQFLPLKSYANIIEGNALRLDWRSLSPSVSYILGNPPFVGYSLQSKDQKNDILCTYVDEKGKPYKTAGKIDYVSGWYFKAAQLMQNTTIRTAFVSTNSITQGEQVAGVWKPLYERFGIHIDFAHRTFKWNSEANQKAQVHCVIVGFSCAENKSDRKLFDNGSEKIVKNISPYLIDAEPIFIQARAKPLCDVHEMVRGSQPTDNGQLILTEEEKAELLKAEPQAEKFIRPFMMGKDFIQRKPRYCLWLVGANPTELRKCHKVMERVEKVREFRLASPKTATQKKAETPTLFDEIKESKTDYVALPKVSSENRRYIPIDYLSSKVIAGDKLFMIADADLYLFGVLTSNVHMAWTRAVCGRLKSDYSYSNTIVYNNFPFPAPTSEQKQKIEQTAQQILDARALYPDSSLADLYDELTMPKELRKAHQANDFAVMSAYGFDKKITESECVAELMKLYQKLI